MSLWKKLWRFGLFSEDKGDYIDVWMMKITITTNQIDMDVYFFQNKSRQHTKTIFVPKVLPFFY